MLARLDAERAAKAERNRVHGDLRVTDYDWNEYHKLPPKERLARLRQYFANPDSDPLIVAADGEHEDYVHHDTGKKVPYSYQGDWGDGSTSMEVPARLGYGAVQDPTTGKWTRPTHTSRLKPTMTDKPATMLFKNAGRGSERAGRREVQRRRTEK